jgi:5'-3' exonuclease
MGRSFDRGGKNRKERERGKRRANRQAERDREAREAVMQAKSAARLEAISRKMGTPAMAATNISAMGASPVAAPPPTPAQVIQQERSGFLSMFKRLFKKSA